MALTQFESNYLAQLDLLRIGTRRKFLGSRQGSHGSPKRGHGIEFSDYRKYELGDNPRTIDWKLYGRSERLYVKLFQEEQNLQVAIIIDISASMGGSFDPQKWEFIKSLALSLSYIALQQQDQVLLHMLGGARTPPLSGGRSFHFMNDFLSKVEPTGQCNFEQAMQRTASQLRFPGVAIVISDFFYPISQINSGIRALRAKNLDITCLQIVSPIDLQTNSESDSFTCVDAETGEELRLELNSDQISQITKLSQEHTAKLDEQFKKTQVGFRSIASDMPMIKVIQNNLRLLGLIGA